MAVPMQDFSCITWFFCCFYSQSVDDFLVDTASVYCVRLVVQSAIQGVN